MQSDIEMYEVCAQLRLSRDLKLIAASAQNPIPLSDGSDRSIACTFDCVDAILKYTDRCC